MSSRGAGVGKQFVLRSRTGDTWNTDGVSDCSAATPDEDLIFNDSSHPENLLLGLNELRKHGHFCDVTLSVSESNFPAHKAVLASFSPYFKAMFMSNLAESQQEHITLNGVESVMVSLLLDYAYTSSITISKSNVQSLLSASNLLEIAPVRGACCRFLERHIDSLNSVGIHCFAEAHACHDLARKAKGFSLKHFSRIMSGEEWLDLPLDKVVEFLSSDELEVPKEEIAYNAASMWLHKDYASRSPVFHKVIVAVGGEDNKVVLQSVECYDPLSHSWRRLAKLPFAVSKHGLVMSGDNILYLAGGEFPDGSVTRFLSRYDPLLDEWHELAPMKSPRSELGLAVLDGLIYAVGGWDGMRRLSTVECYNPKSNTWTSVSSLQITITSPAVAACDRKLYVCGGTILEDGEGIDQVQFYDPNEDVWTLLPSMAIPRSGSSAAVVNGVIYVMGGWHASTENTNRVEKFDTRTKTWSQVANMKERRYRPGVAEVYGKIYILGGEDGWEHFHDTIECYDPDTNTWSMVGEMLSGRSWLSCAPLRIKKDVVADITSPVS